MTEFVPDGYISVREAVNRLGCELFPEEWTGKKHEARRGLIREEEWLKIKDLAPAVALVTDPCENASAQRFPPSRY
jgi:hypothetical protein